MGRTYEALLSARDITSIAALQALFHGSLRADATELQRYLSEVVGIRNSRHARSVVEHITTLDWAGEGSGAGADPARVTLAVEGNIGAGKSTFLDIMSDRSLELQDIIEVVPEPVDEWQAVTGVAGAGAEPVNLLDRFYKDPKRYAYTFQHYVLLTRMQKAGSPGRARVCAGGQTRARTRVRACPGRGAEGPPRCSCHLAAARPRWGHAVELPSTPSAAGLTGTPLPHRRPASRPVLQDRNSRSGLKPLRVLERSIFSDRMVFVRAMHESGFMQDLEVSIYDSW